MSEDRPDQGESIDLSARLRAYESVKAVSANDHHVDGGGAAVRGVVTTVLADSWVLTGLPRWPSNCRSGWRRPWNGVPRIGDSPRWTLPRSGSWTDPATW